MLDIDGVIADFTRGLLEAAQELWPYREWRYKDCTHYDYWSSDCKLPFKNKDEYHEAFARVNFKFLRRSPDFPKWIDIAKEADYVKVVTGRDKLCLEDTIYWLQMNKIPYKCLVFDNEKWKHLFTITHVLEDQQFIVDRIKKEHPDIKIIPVPRPWNRMEE